MKIALLSALLVASAACGMDEAAPADPAAVTSPLVGSWALATIDGHALSPMGWTINADGTYVRTGDGASANSVYVDPVTGLAKYPGHWTATDSTITMTSSYYDTAARAFVDSLPPVASGYLVHSCAQGTCLDLALDRTTWARQ